MKEKTVLLVFPSIFSKCRTRRLLQVIKQKLRSENIEIERITYENSALVFEVNNLIDAASSISQLFGVDNIAIGRAVRNEFCEIVDTIVKTGKKIIMPNNTFYIKIQIDDDTDVDFVTRDILFVSSGNILGNMSKAKGTVRLAKNEADADHLILCYIGQNSSYVCTHLKSGISGLPLNSQNVRVTCSIHNILSATSCLLSMKCGLTPDICILYTHEEDLWENVKMFGCIASKMNLEKQKIRLGYIQSERKSNQEVDFLIKDAVSVRVLSALSSQALLLPLNAAMYPFWYVESTMKKVARMGKTPLTPLLFLTDEISTIAKDAGFKDEKDAINEIAAKKMITKKEYYRHHEYIAKLSHVTLKNMKTVSFNKGPNYLHDIIDSI